MIDKQSNEEYEIVDLKDYGELRKVNYSVESSNTKPFDISLMTGNPQTNKKGSDEK